MDHLILESVHLVDEIIHVLKIPFPGPIFVFRGLIPVIGEVFVVVMITVFADEIVPCEALIVIHVFLTCLASEIIPVVRIIRRVIDKLVYDVSLSLSLAFDHLFEVAWVRSQRTRFDILYHDVFQHASFAVLRMIHWPDVALQRRRAIIVRHVGNALDGQFT